MDLCGHGHFGLQASMDFNADLLQDHEYSSEEVAMALACLPVVD